MGRKPKTSKDFNFMKSHCCNADIIDKNYSTNSNTIVHNIEQRLGVDMDINSDKELCEVLRENGAGPLYDLLKAAYGKKQKTSGSRIRNFIA